MQKHMNDEFQKLISNQKFIEWVEKPTPELNRYWKQFIDENPELKSEITHARYILKRLQQNKQKLKDKDIEALWLNIKSKIDAPTSNKRILKKWLIAASIFLAVGMSGLVFYHVYFNINDEINYQEIAQKVSSGNEVKLILSDNTEKSFNSKEPLIRYNKKGEIKIDSLSGSKQLELSKNVDDKAFNQLIVPKGKRSDLTLADGTRIFLNSGSRVIYPAKFNKKVREIYIEGEAYLEVKHHADWPFVVSTDHMKIKDLGTEFNVKSYRDEDRTSVVLVKGSVQSIVKSQKVLMHVGELFTLSNQSGNTKIKKVDVSEYVSWKDGWLNCNNESIESIATKLSRYFDVNIKFQDPAVKALTMSGKLDLKSECSEIFDVISFSAPIDYKEVNGSIILTMKKSKNKMPME